MDEVIKKIASLLTFIDLKHPGTQAPDMPYCSYEYNSNTFYNQYQILFTMDVTARTAEEAETLSNQIRKTLHENLTSNTEAAFKITGYPSLASVPPLEEDIHIRRLNFTIIAYFKED